MNNTTAVVGGIIAVIIIGGLIFYGVQNNDNIAGTPSPSPSPSTPTPSPNPSQPQNPRVPIAVTNSSAAPTDTTVVLSGYVVPNGSFTNYWYEYGVTASLGNKTTTQMAGSGYGEIRAPAYITGLTRETTYFYRLVAENALGRVAGTQYSFQTTKGVSPPVGSAPLVKTLAASGISRNTVNLNGEVTPNQAATEHWFEYGKSTNLGNTTAFVAVGSGTSKVPASISLTDLDPVTTYYYRLNAQNQFGTVNGAILNFKTTGPSTTTSAPTVTTRAASDIATTTAILHGTIASNGQATQYWFEYSTDSLLGAVLLKSTAKKSAGAAPSPTNVEGLQNVTGLTGNTNYYFRVVAENSHGLVRGEKQTFKTK